MKLNHCCCPILRRGAPCFPASCGTQETTVGASKAGRRATFKCPACCGVGRGLGAPPRRSGEQQRTLPCLAAPTSSRPRQRRGHWRQQPVKQQRPGRFLRQRAEDRGQVKGDGGAEARKPSPPLRWLLATSGPSPASPRINNIKIFAGRTLAI